MIVSEGCYITAFSVVSDGNLTQISLSNKKDLLEGHWNSSQYKGATSELGHFWGVKE